ncbi:MAG: cell division protein FtsZ [Rickettsiales bacterium]|nr:cell division protein FtsZ [Rickettsiales bacterium]
MTLHLQMPAQVNNLSPRILVIGVGGAGGNIINSMKESGVDGVEFLNVNTDSQQLKNSKVEKTLQLGPSCTMGLGAGADPEMGKKSAEEVAGEIEDYLEGSHLVFLTAGMGGGTGTGASPVIARIAKELGILTVGVVTKPFEMEGKRKIKRAEEGILELQKYVDNLIVIPNQNIFHLAKPQTSFTDSLQFADNVLIDGVKSIIDLMVNPGIMNHDFADVKAIMSETGKVHLGTGISEGENRVTEATEMAISNPLLENNSMKGAKGVLINVRCGDDTSLHDIDLAINRVQEESYEDANIIWGVQKDKELEGKFKISVVSTGIDCENYYKNIIQNEKITNIQTFQSTEDTNKISQGNLKTENPYEKKQTSFFVDLQETSKKIEKKNITTNQEEEIIINKELKPEKKSFLSMIFGTKRKIEEKNDKKEDISPEEESSIEFKNEMKEIFENKTEKNAEESDMELDESITEIKPDENNLDDDLLQIPAFLRRQAN